MHIKGPIESQKFSISVIEANSLEEATHLFAKRKVLSRKEFDKLFTIKEIKQK